MRRAAYFCIVAVTALLTLIYGQGLIIPFISAFLLWFLTIEVRKLLNRFSFFDKYLPNVLKNGVVFILMIIALSVIIEILVVNISGLVDSIDRYEANLQNVIQGIKDRFNIDVQSYLDSMSENFQVGNVLSTMASGLSGFMGNMMMILIYALFIFLEEASFREKIAKYFDSEARYQQFIHTVERIEKSTFDYLRLKTLVSLLTGVLSYIVLLLVGIDSAMFWAFLIFLLNYIPTIGSLSATVFPAVFSLVQFGTLTPSIIILVLVGAIQLIIGNIIEPRIMGKSLNVSPLVTIIALAVWGQIWGVVGMVLSVPIMVITIIILSQFDSTRKLAALLTETGEIEE